MSSSATDPIDPGSLPPDPAALPDAPPQAAPAPAAPVEPPPSAELPVPSQATAPPALEPAASAPAVSAAAPPPSLAPAAPVVVPPEPPPTPVVSAAPQAAPAPAAHAPPPAAVPASTPPSAAAPAPESRPAEPGTDTLRSAAGLDTIRNEPAAHPFARDEDRGLDPISLLPVALTILLLVGTIWQCVDSGDEADEPVADAAPAVEDAEAPPAPDAPKAPRAKGARLKRAETPPPEDASDAPSAAPEATGSARPATATSKTAHIGEYEGPALGSGGPSAHPDAERLAAEAEEHYEAGRIDQAVRSIDDALRRSPKVARFEAFRALMLHKQHKDEEALTQYTAAVTHDPKNPEIYRQRATVNVALGRHAHASRDMRAYDRLKAGTSPTAPP